MGWHWTELFRLRCGAIASVREEHTAEASHLHVTLCTRWRWHRGECRDGG